MARAKTNVSHGSSGYLADALCVVEPRGFEPPTPCMPLMLGWFTTPGTTSPTHATEQVKGAAEGCAVGRGEVACGVVSGKSLARPCAVARHDASATSLRLALGEEQLAPLVQCCPRMISGRG
jgi:hypothetical protein